MKRKHIWTKYIYNILVERLSNNENFLMKNFKSMLIHEEKNLGYDSYPRQDKLQLQKNICYRLICYDSKLYFLK